METIHLLHIIHIEPTKWERIFGHPYRRLRKRLHRLIEEKTIEGIVTTADIADELGHMGVPYLLKRRVTYKRGGIRRNSRREWYIAVTDDGTESTDELLERIYEDFNYMAIVTERPEHYSNFVDEVYEETGLLIRISDHVPKRANILLDMKP